eukprot:TRINITY_DN14529_c0_g1_i1.p1 TRINITY_DN14529_c0_g1~~TRINITY_DN14529_c0_g1_i1.p1  ORF type:complete len:361 (-),score=73.66 TRINITY_DN14529_c0_g1_i1:13-1095(-)
MQTSPLMAPPPLAPVLPMPVVPAAAPPSSAPAPAPPVRTRKRMYTQEVQQMMFTFGDTRGNSEAAELVEQVVRQRIMDMARQAHAIAQRRGNERLSAEDLVFLARKDPAKYRRLRDFVECREIRKSLRAAANAVYPDGTVAEIPPIVKPEPEGEAGGAAAAAPAVPPAALGEEDLGAMTDEKKLFSQRKRLRRTWDFEAGLWEEARCVDRATEAELRREFEATAQQKRREMDELTKTMSTEQYLEFVEARQASFNANMKKLARFRVWLDQVAAELSPYEDALELLGYLAWEEVAAITATALQVKRGMEGLPELTQSPVTLFPYPQRQAENAQPQTPLTAMHVREAVRRMTPARHSEIDFV